MLTSNQVQQKVAERTLCIILEGIHESLREMWAEIALQVEADKQVHGILHHFYIGAYISHCLDLNHQPKTQSVLHQENILLSVLTTSEFTQIKELNQFDDADFNPIKENFITKIVSHKHCFCLHSTS